MKIQIYDSFSLSFGDLLPEEENDNKGRITVDRGSAQDGRWKETVHFDQTVRNNLNLLSG